jgi:hypothetical protein
MITKETKTFTSLDDALWFIDDTAGYVLMDGKFEVNLVLVNRKFKVTIEAEVEVE